MTEESSIVRAFAFQGAACTALGSAFSGGLLARASADFEAGGPVRDLMAPWAGADVRAIIADAVPLRLLGALHEAVLAGAAPDLAAAYPDAGREGAARDGDVEAAWSAAAAFLAGHAGAVAQFITHEPQTNEVRRSACLLPGFLAVAAATGMDLACLELGASAGLNQLWDRYHYRLGEAGSWGPEGSAVEIDTDWRGPPPALGARVRVAERAACDRKPVNLADPAARRRLKAYVWPDQADRLARLDGAIATALAARIQVEAQDAVTWAAAHAAPRAGLATVLFHSVFWQYMPAASQTALAEVIAGHGAAARPDAPFAWLRMEPGADSAATMELRLTLWPDGEDRRLAFTHPHGAWVEWVG